MGTHGLNYPPLGAHVMLTYATGATKGPPTTGVKRMIVPFHFGRFSRVTRLGNGRSQALRVPHLSRKIRTSKSTTIKLYVAIFLSCISSLNKSASIDAFFVLYSRGANVGLRDQTHANMAITDLINLIAMCTSIACLVGSLVGSWSLTLEYWQSHLMNLWNFCSMMLLLEYNLPRWCQPWPLITLGDSNSRLEIVMSIKIHWQKPPQTQ